MLNKQDQDNDRKNAGIMAQHLVDVPKKINKRQATVTFTLKNGEINLIHYLLTMLAEGAYTASPDLMAELDNSLAWIAKWAADHDGDGTGLSERAMKRFDRNVAAIAKAQGD